MKASYKIYGKGNLSIQTEYWQIPMEVAKLLVAYLKADGRATPGTYWEANALKPIRRAIRAKLEIVKLYTAGFSTGDLANMLRCVGCEIEYAGAE